MQRRERSRTANPTSGHPPHEPEPDGALASSPAYDMRIPKAGEDAGAPVRGENLPNEISRLEPLNRGDESFGVPALAGLANVADSPGNRLKPGLQTKEVHGEGRPVKSALHV